MTATGVLPIFDDVIQGRYALLAEALEPAWPGREVADIWRTAS